MGNLSIVDGCANMPIDGRSQKSYQTFTGFDTGELRSAHAKH
jgi:hypothetical protein